MPTDPALNNPESAARPSVSDDTVLNNENIGDLRREIERLRTELARATADAEHYRQAAYAYSTNGCRTPRRRKKSDATCSTEPAGNL